MIRTALFLAFISAATPFTFAAEPLSTDGAVLGVAAGVYEGRGTLVSDSWMIPNVDFTSRREVRNGAIIARTTATLLGFEVAKASARLQVIPTGSGKFDMIDLDTRIKAGGGECSGTACTFEATVMKGDLTLKETWIANDEGFAVVDGSQVSKQKAATYEAAFSRVSAE